MIYGVSVVRNEADVIVTCLRHHLLAERFDRILIADNGSEDGTPAAIRAMDDPAIDLIEAPGQYFQSEIVTGLARRAHAEGASWVVPFDADEFWHVEGGLGPALRERDPVGAIKVEVVNYIQDAAVGEPHDGSILKARYRVAEPFCDYPEARAAVERDRCSYVESPYPEKYIVAASRDMRIAPGAHGTQPGLATVAQRDLRCLHVPLRSKRILDRKVEQSRRLDEAGFDPEHGWHLRRFAAVAAAGGLDREWIANAQDGGVLRTRRGPVALEYDPTLANLLRPLVAPTLADRARTFGRRLLGTRVP